MPTNPCTKPISLLVYGGTEAGIFCAVQAARSGLHVILISETKYPYGYFPSLGAWETHYPGVRSPLSSEVKSKLADHYQAYFGINSIQYRDCVNLEDNNPMMTFEPHVAEKVLEELLAAEKNLTLIAPARITRVCEADGRLKSISLISGNKAETLSANLFADCSYTGDLAAMTKAEFTLGREAKSVTGEIHAGKIFTRWKKGSYPQESVEGRLNILPTWTTTSPLEGSTGEGDANIQDYSYRLCLSSDEHNRIVPPKPPGYNRELYAPLLLLPEEKATLQLPFHHRWISQDMEEMMENDHLFHGHALPSNKRSWNATNFTGEGKHYTASGTEERLAIEKRHRYHALGLLYFLQNDLDVPATVQRVARQWGLAKDEFVFNDYFPPALYVREARRFKGSYLYREQDCLKADGLDRAPIHRDGIAFTEFPLDSLACTTERMHGSNPDGQFFEKDKSLTGSLPWRCLLPLGVKNLVVPSTPSVTHCAWGTVRQSACLLHLAEVCAFAAEICSKQQIDFAGLSPLDLQVHLVQKGAMISFFNDFDMETSASWKEAALLFGTWGFFSNYDAKPHEPLDARLAKLWITALQSTPAQAPHEVARKVREMEQTTSLTSISGRTFTDLLGIEDPSLENVKAMTRKQGLDVLYSVFLSSRN